MDLRTHEGRATLLRAVATILACDWDFTCGEDPEARITEVNEWTSTLQMEEPHDGETVTIEIGYARTVPGFLPETTMGEVVQFLCWGTDRNEAQPVWVSPLSSAISALVVA